MPRPNRRMEVYAVLPERADVMRATASKIGTNGWLMERTGMSKASVNDYLRELKADGLAHIARRNRTNKMPAAVWAKGPGEDAPLPPPLGDLVYNRRYRKNVRKAIDQGKRGKRFDDRYARHVARAIAEDVAARTRINPQHPFSALGI